MPWMEKNIPIPPGIYNEVCRVIKTKIDAGVYEPSNSSYRSRWFCVIKKDGKSLRLVHSLEPLNQVTIAHSGIPPAGAGVSSQALILYATLRRGGRKLRGPLRRSMGITFADSAVKAVRCEPPKYSSSGNRA